MMIDTTSKRLQTMRKSRFLIMAILIALFSECYRNSQKTEDDSIKDYDIDFNWGE